MEKTAKATGKFTPAKTIETAIATNSRCHWIKTATAIFQQLQALKQKTRLKLFNGNGNGQVFYDGTTSSFVVVYSGNSFSEATGIFDALRDLQQNQQLTVENFEAIERPVFMLQAKIL